jgi:hypothetical protein
LGHCLVLFASVIVAGRATVRPGIFGVCGTCLGGGAWRDGEWDLSEHWKLSAATMVKQEVV